MFFSHVAKHTRSELACDAMKYTALVNATFKSTLVPLKTNVITALSTEIKNFSVALLQPTHLQLADSVQVINL